MYDATLPGERSGESQHERLDPGFPMDHVQWKPVTVAREYAGVTASENAAGVERSREIAFMEAGVLLLPQPCARSYTTFPRDNRSRIPYQ